MKLRARLLHQVQEETVVNKILMITWALSAAWTSFWMMSTVIATRRGGIVKALLVTIFVTVLFSVIGYVFYAGIIAALMGD